MEEHRNPPKPSTPEATPESPPTKTHEIKWPKRGEAPALRATAYPRGRVPATSGLSTRDLRLLGWMCEMYGARLDHLQALTGSSTTMVRRIVRNLRHAELARTERIVVGETTWVIPTAAGLAACALPYEVWTPGLGQLTHVGAMNDVRVHLQTRTPEAEWISERRVMWEYKRENTTRVRSRKHIPDGVALLEGRRVAIEVELSEKGTAKLKLILDELARRFDATLYFCAPGPYEQLVRMERSGRWRTLGVRELPVLSVKSEG